MNMLLISQGKPIKRSDRGHSQSFRRMCELICLHSELPVFKKLKFFASLHCLRSLKSCDRMLTLSALNLSVKLCNAVSKAYKHLC